MVIGRVNVKRIGDKMQENKQETISRILAVFSALLALAGCLTTMVTININFMGNNLYSQNMGILSLIKNANTGDGLNKVNSLGLQNFSDIGEKLINIMILPISLYLFILLLIIVVMISILINKFNRTRMILCSVLVVSGVYLTSVMQNLPIKVMQSLNLNKMPEIIDWSQLVEVNIGIGHWIMLVAIIIMTLIAILKRIKAKTKRFEIDV